MTRMTSAFAIVATSACFGCMEDPVLDHVGGSGTITSDASRPCPETVPDARPRSLPCDVEAVLAKKCQRCHNSKAHLDVCYPAKTCLRGPFPLLTWSDTHEDYGGKPVFERMRDAVESDYMPFKTTMISPPVEPLTTAEKSTLIAWTKSCAPPGTVACPASVEDARAPADGAVEGGAGDR